MNTLNPKRPAPLRCLRQWLFCERPLRAAPALELDVLELQLNREQSLLIIRARESEVIEGQLDHLRAGIAGALTDAETPGIITALEARALAGGLITATLATHKHTQALEAMV